MTSNDGCEKASGNCGNKDRGSSTDVVDGGSRFVEKDTDDWYVISDEHGECSNVVSGSRVSHDKELEKTVIDNEESVVSCKGQGNDEGGLQIWDHNFNFRENRKCQLPKETQTVAKAGTFNISEEEKSIY